MSKEPNDTQNSGERHAIDQLDKRLDALSKKRTASEAKALRTPKSVKGAGQGMKMATDMVAAVAVGGVFGWALDSFFGTLPLFFLVMLLFGIAAGILNVYRSALNLEGGFSQADRVDDQANKKDKQNSGERPSKNRAPSPTYIGDDDDD